MKNIKIKLLASLLLTSAFFLSACSEVALEKDQDAASKTSEVETPIEKDFNEPLAITHELGTVTLEKTPEKIVVFDYGILDMFKSLNIIVHGLPKSNLPSFLDEYQGEDFINVGSLKEPDFETVYEMNPDVIFISGRASGAYEELSKIAPTIYLAIDANDYMGSLEKNGKMLGQIFSKEAEVETIMNSLKDKATKIKEKALEKDEEALVILTNDGSISAYGKNSRFGIIHNGLGFREVDENIETSTHGQSVSFEYLLEKNPKRLFIIDRAQVVGGEITASKTLDNDLVKATDAYKEENMVYLDPMVWYISAGGFMSTDLMLDEVLNSIE